MPATPTGLKAIVDKIRNPAWLCFLWFGLTAGISLLEAPVKFTAPTLSREVALDVGRVVFQALNTVELVLLVLLLVLVRVGNRARNLWAWCALLALIMMLQSVWLLPELSARAASIVSGVEPGESIAHGAYAVTELIKLAVLLLLGFRLMPGGRPAR